MPLSRAPTTSGIGSGRGPGARLVKKGKVISQKPKAGKHLKHNAKVSVTVSKGKKH
jgi:PASTA domain